MVERRGSAGALHKMWPDRYQRASRTVAFSEVTNEALVVGSMQPLAGEQLDLPSASGMGREGHPADANLDVTRAKPAGMKCPLEVVRRRSGGGAVYVAPGQQLWVDLWIPRDDPLFEEDVLRTSILAGRVWARALEKLGVSRIEIHGGRVALGRWGALVCFASLGPGEVLTGGRKSVGIAQRRDRDGAWLQTMLPLIWNPAYWVPSLTCAGMRQEDSKALEQWLMDNVAGHIDSPLGSIARNALTDAIVSHLPL
ncbi:MAG: hypothetical protein M1399_02945 [Actinobacteria bacterium]|nr:hypothetical protein [Actinomycetota bacterium]MCL5446366.1 hypothetical protein [Actinomycetota bacterium]